MPVRFEVLGPVRLGHDGEAAVVSGVLRRNLLAMLLARANELVSVDLLRDALWGERTDSDGVHRLQLHVHKLRGMLDDPGRLWFGSGGYGLRVRPGELDADRFTALLDEASAERDPGHGVELMRRALGLWRGEPFQGVDVPHLLGDVQRLTERRLAALEQLYGAELRRGRHAAIIGELAELVVAHPLRERLHGLLMTALYRAGRRADALAAYRTAREVLVDELGLEPGPQLRALESRILSGEPIGPARRAVPAQLPHDTAGFVGRDAELSELDRLLAGGGESVVIAAVSGAGGVGKTALAVRWAHRVRDRFPDGQLYVDLRGYGPDQPAAPGDVLAAFLRAFGVDGTAIPASPAERAARFRTLVDSKRLVIVLDNARDADQVRPLLPGTPTCFVVVTSRDALAGLGARDGAHRITVDRMAGEQARRLLTGLVGDVDRAAVEQLVERCARLPLALRIAAERIREQPGRPVAELVAELDDEQARLDLLDTGDPQASVRAVFSSSYRHLDAPTARLFRLFGLHPGPDLDLPALTALAGGDPRGTRLSLRTLVRAHLVERTGDDRFHLHDLLWTYAAELAQTVETEARQRDARARLCDHYLRAASAAAEFITPNEWRPPGAATVEFTSYQTAIRWLDTERTTLIRTATSAASWGLPGYTTDFCAALSWYLDVGRYLDEAARLHGAAHAVARERGDTHAEGIALRGLGMVGFRLGRLDEAQRHLEDALAAHEAPLWRAGTLTCLGMVHGFTGSADDAIAHLRRSVELYRGFDELLAAHRPLVALGHLYRRRGEHEPAGRCLREALAIAQRADNPSGQAHASYGLAGLYRDTGRYDDALDCAHRALLFARTAGMRFLEGISLNRIGTIHQRRKDYQQARRSFREAIGIARASANTQLEAKALNGLGEAHTAGGTPAEAVGHHIDALTAATDAGSRYEQARAHAGLAIAYADTGKPLEAAEHGHNPLVGPRIGRVELAAELGPVLERVGLGRGWPVVVLVGGAGGTSEAALRRWDGVLRAAVLPVLDACDAAVVDGGTNSGVMRVIGRARAATGGRFPLVGVAAEGTVADVAAVEPNHTHLVLVPGRSWGDESPWLADVAAAIAGAHRSVTLVVNGGAITYDDIDRSLAGGRPVVVLNGTGRTADAVSAAVAGHGDDPRAERVARSPLVRVLHVDDRDAIAGALAAALGGQFPVPG